MKTGFVLFLLCCCTLIQAAEWPECRRAKQDALSLEQALRKGLVLRGYANRSEMRQVLREHDRWLWRNCRRYSSEMRELSVRR